MDTLSFALAYIREGWAVFPVIPKGKSPATLHGFKDASHDENKARSWFASGHYNIGIATGETSGIIVVDIDDEEGEAEWRAIASQNEPFATREARTGGGGRHILFRHPGIHVGNRTPFRHIHIRGDGGYIVAPPSIHPSGRRYEWLNDLPVAPMPIWLLNMLLGKESKETASDQPPAPGPSPAPPSGSNSRYAQAALKSAYEHVSAAAEGTRNNTLNDETFALAAFIRDGLLSRAEVEQVMEAAARACGLPDSEARRTIASALDAGVLRSRRVLNIRDTTRAGNRETAADASAPGDEPDKSEPDARAPEGTPTHDDLAAQWLADHPNTKYGMGHFYRYRAGYWAPVADGEIESELYPIMVEAKRRKFRPTAPALSSIRKLASVACTVPDECWDANYDLIVCSNGTLNISRMELRDHDPQDYQTGALPFAYDPDADCPTFKRVLRERVPYAADFLQEWAGYCLTTDTSHEIALWLYGPRASGKSTVIEAFQVLLGKRAGILGLADIGSNRFALADLPGKTLVLSTEQPSSYVGSTHILNQIISGESIMVERKYHDAYRITPRAKIMWAMNELPRIGNASDGIWRRIKVVEFPQTILNPDPKIKEAVKMEGPGILNWALEGLLRLRGRGAFEIPERVNEASARYAHINDIPSVFVEDCCLIGSQYETGSDQLYQAYKQWCEQNGHKPQSATSIAEDWRRLGFEKVTRSGRRFWQGVGLRV